MRPSILFLLLLTVFPVPVVASVFAHPRDGLYIFIGIVILLIVFGVPSIIWCWCRRREAKKKAVMSAEESVMASVVDSVPPVTPKEPNAENKAPEAPPTEPPAGAK